MKIKAYSKLRAGMDIKIIQKIFEHSNSKMTEIYARTHQDKVFEEAKEISPEF